MKTKEKGERYRIALDFDGVIHKYSSPWAGNCEIPDDPVDGAIDAIRNLYKKFDIVIFTTRAINEASVEAIRSYLVRNGLEVDIAEKILITNVKIACLLYVDDRAFRFVGRFPTPNEVHRSIPWNRDGGTKDDLIELSDMKNRLCSMLNLDRSVSADELLEAVSSKIQ